MRVVRFQAQSVRDEVDDFVVPAAVEGGTDRRFGDRNLKRNRRRQTKVPGQGVQRRRVGTQPCKRFAQDYGVGRSESVQRQLFFYLFQPLRNLDCACEYDLVIGREQGHAADLAQVHADRVFGQFCVRSLVGNLPGNGGRFVGGPGRLPQRQFRPCESSCIHAVPIGFVIGIAPEGVEFRTKTAIGTAWDLAKEFLFY